MLHLYAALAEKERRLISARTKAALGGAKLKEGAMPHSLVGRQMGRWRVVRYVGVTGVSHAPRHHWYECVM